MTHFYTRLRDRLRLNRAVDKAVYRAKNLFYSISAGASRRLPSSGVALCLRFRNEARYLREWIEYYLSAGIAHFYLYNNYSTDNYLEVLQPFIDKGLVTLIDWPFTPASPRAEHDCIRRAIGRYKWVGFLDADEFVVIKDHRSIPDFLIEYTKYPALALHWYFFGSNGHRLRPAGPVLESYTKRRDTPDIHVKVFVQAAEVTRCNNSHSWFYRKARVAVNEHKLPVWGSRGYPPTADAAWINHYYTKSEEDYLSKIGQAISLDVSGMKHPSRTSVSMLHHLTDNNHVECMEAIRYRDRAKHPTPVAPLKSKEQNKTQPRVCIVILNWNGWKDTIECLESVFRLNYPHFSVVVCDNASTDDSIRQIENWALGSIEVKPINPALAALTTPAVPKPIPYTCIEEANILETAGFSNAPLTLIKNRRNNGFAGGCNVGIRFALGQHDNAYIWLLNNDTVVAPDALTELIGLMESNQQLGLAGSTIFEYHYPTRVQAYGGTRYNPWMARTPRSINAKPGGQRHLDCILGCSTLVSMNFLRDVGLMEESYFLYFEELDWAERAKGLYELGYAPGSHIYHKEGASIGSSRDRAQRSELSELYLARNRVLFTKRFHPFLLPSVLFWVWSSALQRITTGQLRRGLTIFTSSIKGLTIQC